MKQQILRLSAVLSLSLLCVSVGRAEEPSPRSGIPPLDLPQAGAKPGPASQPLPSTPAERAKLLANLYAYLATADSPAQAAPVMEAIERLWLFADSDTIQLLVNRSTTAVAQKNLDLALRLMDAVVDLAPDYAEGWNRRALVHYLRNDVERMVGDLRRCLALEPNHYQALEILGEILKQTGQKKAALKAFERLIEVNPNAPGAQDAVKELSRDVDGQRT